MSEKKWYELRGEDGDTAVSTRIRLARNLEDFPFPVKLGAEERREVCEVIRSAASEVCPELFSVDMQSLSRAQIISLAERHLISPEFAAAPEGRVLLTTENESIGIMLCEEDHIRLQVMCAGLCLKEAYACADRLDKALNSRLRFAFDERLGYLTQCPTNLGTAMRASVMLHLPALTMTGRISRLASAVSKIGLVVRGCYGEGSGAKGDLYQVSNQITLGITEEVAIENLGRITAQIITQERAAAKELLSDPSVLDKVHRALGVLKSAYLLSGDELMDLASLVRMGAANDLLPLPLESLNELMINMQPATLNAACGKSLSPEERDVIRAQRVREALINA